MGLPNEEKQIKCKYELAADEISNGQNCFEEGIAPDGEHPIEQQHAEIQPTNNRIAVNITVSCIPLAEDAMVSNTNDSKRVPDPGGSTVLFSRVCPHT